ncbi:receptor-like serine/threonine-protein kinase NCRK [Tripterygium wilfordii]|uniref:receptor-like serine/threonine-protein kinase NCRK n=1 Tax=Tripterygium wilfordii TaxID=458696 RepID=UPI0018F8598C|nr:receptor-like serine/threonine-protein kinase NCRK [Tripterygium wilfordii]XP_038722545.1 receptor-like serine/threonine-protein kinase NCRK [Tripterygium wilfordii]XP_038722553.1 receptor-like serine/threonine-protein kinase NCRK [Tripterygium wilfordii]XP_038722561.1 receptor-like serine/threonine-protein kinase NCRK [Tripterygium wilfordii]
MNLQAKASLACLIGFILVLPTFCDELYNASGTNNWTCTCSSSNQGNQSYLHASNCSTSCDCSPERGPIEGVWRCMCAADGFPKVAADSHEATCFTSCNCTSGFPSDSKPPRKHISSKVVVIILLLCVILTTLAFLASVICYVYRKEKFPNLPPLFSSVGETSWNSATNLISRTNYSFPETIVSIGSPINPIAGCFGRAFLCRSETGTICGTFVRFPYSVLENATDKFSNSNLIGVGGSSYVYRGQLNDGMSVAVKRLMTQAGPDADSVFTTEVELLSRLHHCHVVPLLGYCLEFQGKHAERLLVFEYMPNGNLRDCLDGVSGEDINWDTRVAISIGVARGLEYLHDAAAPRILHRDIKSTNILLDENWRAKITDLGMAKPLRADGVPSSSSSPARMQGTFGYFAPEYAMVGRASLMSDVFSFGVILLELITGRKPIYKLANKGEESLVLWAMPHLQDSRQVILDLPDPRLKGNFLEEDMQIMAYLAKECLLLDPDARPTMSEVVQILSTIAPDKSRRRNIPVNHFQMSSADSMKSEPQRETPADIAELTAGTAQQRQAVSSGCSAAQDLLPVDTKYTLCLDGNNVEPDGVPTEYMERVTVMRSKTESWCALDDEIVDLTEPRYESFSVANVN